MKLEQVQQLLKNGNQRQQRALQAIEDLSILNVLIRFDPFPAGTIPLDVDINNSDIDILCFTKNLDDFKLTCLNGFSILKRFSLREKNISGTDTVICNFTFRKEIFELFCQDIPVQNQYGYRHFVVEHKLLNLGGDTVRNQIRNLKKKGIKTEPAFARCFSLEGDPYRALYDLYGADTTQLEAVAAASK
jgi:hypothetical protein